MIRLASATVFLALLAGPAAASPFCHGGETPGFRFGFGIQIGGDYTESQQAEFDRMALQKIGVDASRVERWNGCMRAWVRQGGGREVMEFYDPATLERVY